MTKQTLSPNDWQSFQQTGYLHLGQVLSQAELAALQQRIDDIMLGNAPARITTAC